MPIRLVLAEDQYLIREALRGLLATRDDFEIAAVCEDLDSLLQAVDAERPDVVVTDIRMPPGNTDEGIQAAIRLRETSGSGYGFQIETTWWAHRRGATIVQVPIIFRERVAGQSKMSGGIVREAMLIVLRLRWRAMMQRLGRGR